MRTDTCTRCGKTFVQEDEYLTCPDCRGERPILESLIALISRRARLAHGTRWYQGWTQEE